MLCTNKYLQPATVIGNSHRQQTVNINSHFRAYRQPLQPQHSRTCCLLHPHCHHNHKIIVSPKTPGSQLGTQEHTHEHTLPLSKVARTEVCRPATLLIPEYFYTPVAADQRARFSRFTSTQQQHSRYLVLACSTQRVELSTSGPVPSSQRRVDSLCRLKTTHELGASSLSLSPLWI